MAKPIKAKIKFVLEGGNATPGQKIGPALGQQGVNIGSFVSKFNEQTQTKKGQLVPVILTVYDDRTFSMEFKQPPAAYLIAKALNLKKGSATSNLQKVGKITRAQLLEIAKIKLPDLNTRNLDAAVNIIAGSAKSMGVEIVN